MFHSVFCRDDSKLSARDLAEWCNQAAAFDDLPRFEPPLENVGDGWQAFELIYDDKKRPLQFMHHAAKDCEKHVTGAVEMLRDRGYSDSELVKRLRESKQVFVIEIDEEGATDDVWELLDVIETRLARERDGVIFSPDEGFFDGKNRPIRSFS